MLNIETKSYIDDLKKMKPEQVDRVEVERGLRLIENEINRKDASFTPADLEELQECLHRLKSRENLALADSFLSSSKKRHMTNIELISSMKRSIKKQIVDIRIQAVEERANQRVQAAERTINQKIERMNQINLEIVGKIAKGLQQIDSSLSDLRYFTLMKFESLKDESLNHELDKMREQTIKYATKDELMRYVGSLMAYIAQLQAALPHTEGLSQINNPYHSIDFQDLVPKLNKLIVEMDSKLKEYNELLLKTDVNMDEYLNIANDVASMHAKLDEAISPIAEMIKQNMYTEQTTFGNYQLYERPREVLAEMGDNINALGVKKGEVKEVATKRAAALAKAYNKSSSKEQEKPIAATIEVAKPELDIPLPDEEKVKITSTDMKKKNF